jgi:hypothetical protein
METLKLDGLAVSAPHTCRPLIRRIDPYRFNFGAYSQNESYQATNATQKKKTVSTGIFSFNIVS